MVDKSPSQELVEIRTGQEIETLLRDLYVTRRWTDQEIADHVGVARATVRTWRAQLGVNRSERKAAVA